MTTVTGHLLAGEGVLLDRQDSVSQYWAPFDHVPTTARLTVVGITLTRKQAINTVNGFR